MSAIIVHRNSVRYTYEARPWSVNSERRDHWTKRGRQTKEWREAFGWLGLRQKARFVSAHVVVTIVMRPPLADTAAANGAVKAAIDGLVDAKILPGDTGEYVLSLTMLPPRKANKGEAESVTLTLIRGGTDLDLLLVPLLVGDDQ